MVGRTASGGKQLSRGKLRLGLRQAGAVMAEGRCSPHSLPARPGGAPGTGRIARIPCASQGVVGAVGSSQAPAGPRPPTPCSARPPRAGRRRDAGAGVPALQPPPGWGQLRSQSSCSPGSLYIVGYYGTAVKYKLEKKHFWRRGLCLSVPWGAPGRGVPSG